MHLRQLLTLSFLINFTTLLNAQTVSDNQILRLETHPTDSAKFIAKMYDSKTGKLEEYWEMITHVPEISIADFNKQVQQREIEPHGKSYLFYENRVKKMEVNYEFGSKMGEMKGYYESGELRFHGNNKGYKLDGKFIHYFKDGTVKKEENYINGYLDKKSMYYYPSGNIYMETNFSFGEKNGKQKIYYPDGKTKREMNYKMNILISEKCYDKEGVRTECNPVITEPNFAKGKDTFLANLQKFPFNNNYSMEDTILCTISLKIDTSGIASIQNFYFTGQDSLQREFTNWIEKPGLFTPLTYYDQPVECNVHIILPIYNNKLVLSEYYNKRHISSRNWFTQEDENTYYWNFSSEDDNTHFIVNEDDITNFFIVEIMPEFPGGDMELRKFMANTIKYPVLAQELGIQGKVYVTFVIDKNGLPVDIKIARSVHPLLDEEAMRVVSLMPQWKPGMQQGIPVRVSYTVPVDFALTKIGGRFSYGTITIEE